jgi:hypothetical protein
MSVLRMWINFAILAEGGGFVAGGFNGALLIGRVNRAGLEIGEIRMASRWVALRANQPSIFRLYFLCTNSNEMNFACVLTVTSTVLVNQP